MESTNNLDKNNNYVYHGSQTTPFDSNNSNNNNTTHCRMCGIKFDNMAKMQRHAMIEHMDKGDILED